MPPPPVCFFYFYYFFKPRVFIRITTFKLFVRTVYVNVGRTAVSQSNKRKDFLLTDWHECQENLTFRYNVPSNSLFDV